MKKQPVNSQKKFSFLNRFLTGLVIALAFTLTAFEWTTVTSEARIGCPFDLRDNLEEILPPITYQLDKVKRVEQEKPSDQIEIVKELTKPDPELIDELEPIVQNVEPLAPIDPEYFGRNDFDKIDDNYTYEKVQVFAHYKKCNGMSGEALQNCSQVDIQQRISKNFKTTHQLRSIGGKQAALVSFVVDKEGNISEIKVERSSSKAMEKAAIRAIEKLPRLDFPANQQGRTVALRMKIPIRLDLRH